MNKKKLRVAVFHCGFVYSGGGPRSMLASSRGFPGTLRYTALRLREALFRMVQDLGGAQLRGYSTSILIKELL